MFDGRHSIYRQSSYHLIESVDFFIVGRHQRKRPKPPFREMFQDSRLIRIQQVIRYLLRQPIAQGQHLAYPGLADPEHLGDIIIF
ncbi:hypothetical protein D1BOALGB6SA_4622 [Olavius sp. associated proteobacterium Delta 1]|nr:hypothetical protein D1BOALGB6SA_4622 [Olavius sp. associated proteobacterium Delta 1]